MKPSALVSSSPGRAEKLPAPGLARLLRGKSTTRNRARSSPMFVSKSRSLGPSSQPTNEAGDPTSPKVTCIGQVRIRKKIKNQTNTDKTPPKPSRSRCWCLKQALLCGVFPKRKNKKICSCGGCRLFCCWRRKKTAEESATAAEDKEAAPPPPPIAFVSIEPKSESSEEEDEEETRVFVPPATTNSSSSPPKNALLLMRCRSAPHNRSSALALCRFPVSPAPASESEEEREKEEEEEKAENEEVRERKSCNESSKDENIEESLKLMPVGLMRCKSEPAKKGEKLMEVSCCKGVVDVGPKSSPPPPPILLH